MDQASPPTPPKIFPEALRESLRRAKVIAMVVIDDPDTAVPLARCLLENGIRAIELTLRTEAAFESLRRIRTECPELSAGLGTLLHPDQVGPAVEAGAAFAVAPGLNPRVVRAAAEAGLPFAPGIVSPTDIEAAVELGCRQLKFFPAEPSGGIPYLKSMHAPYAHLGLEYIPLGGLTADNYTDYLAVDCIPAVGGSWIAPRDRIREQDWDSIAANARQAIEHLPKT